MSFFDYEEWLKLTTPPHCRENKIAALRYMAPTHLVSTTLGPQTQAHCTTQLHFSLSLLMTTSLTLSYILVRLFCEISLIEYSKVNLVGKETDTLMLITTQSMMK